MWKHSSITKKPDGTFIVTHKSAQGSLLYHVCPKTADPANLYDIAEVAAFWESLPDNDPRKQVYVDPEPESDTRTPAEKRADVYAAEADPLFQQAMYYQAEADGLKAAGEYEMAAAAEAKATEYKRRYAAAKVEIRLRFPESGE